MPRFYERLMSLDKPHEAYVPFADEYGRHHGKELQEDDPPYRSLCRSLLQSRLNGTRVLEIGCGPALDGHALQEAGLKVTAIDLCQPFIELGRPRFPSIDFHCMDMRHPTFPDASFDGILGMACFCHITKEEVGPTVMALARLLSTGGVFVLSLMDSTSVQGYRVDEWGGVKNNPVDMICHERTTMIDHLAAAGLMDISVRAIDSPFYAKIPRIADNAIELYVISGVMP